MPIPPQMIEERELMLDDDRDILNDETFGGDVDGDYDWEAAPPPEDLFNFDHPSAANGKQDSGAYGHSRPPLQTSEAGGGDHEDQDGGYMNVEESISRLVQEDEDTEDERDMFVRASHKSMMPPQVITRNLNLMGEKEFGSSLFGSSVWAMNPTDVLQGNAGGGATPRPVVTRQSSNRPPPGVGETPLDERLKNLQDNDAMVRSAYQMLMDIAKKQPEIVTSETAAKLAIGKAQIEVTTDYINHSTALAQSHGLLPGLDRAPMIRHAPPPGTNDFPGGHTRPMMPPGMRPPPHFGPVPPGMPGFHPVQRFQPPHPNLIGNRGGSEFFPPHHQFPHHPGNQRFHTRFRSGDSNEGRGGDRYAGLMTEKDKQRLRNIQMLQLHNDHPYTTDFYYQMKKYNEDGDIAHLKKVFPAASDRPPRNPYQPTRFENALGKLQAVSALAPKRVIDTYLQVPFTSVHDRKSRARVLRGIEEVHRLYLDIKEYKYRQDGDTLDEEHDSRAEILTYTKVLQALDQHQDNFSRWLLRKKGRALLYRLVEEFVQYERGRNAGYMIFTNMLLSSTIITMKRMEHDQELIGNILYYVEIITEANVTMVDLMLQGMHPELYKAAFGSTMYILIMERAADLVMNKMAPICWSTFNLPLEQYPIEYPVLNTYPGDELTGFVRFPSLIKSFLDCKLEELGRPFGSLGIWGQRLENLMSASGNKDVLDALESFHPRFNEFRDKIVPAYTLPDYPDSPE